MERSCGLKEKIMPPGIDKDRCIKCGKCVDVCQMDVFFDSREGETPCVTYPEECWHCNACVLDCPVDGAIRLRIPFPMVLLYK